MLTVSETLNTLCMHSYKCCGPTEKGCFLFKKVFSQFMFHSQREHERSIRKSKVVKCSQ